MKRVLFVDDEPNLLSGLRNMLRPMRAQWDMVFVPCAEEAKAQVERTCFDAVITDLYMPGMDGMQLLKHLRQDDRYAGVAIIVLTGAGSESIAVNAMKAGAQDYLVKGSISFEQLKDTVESAIASVSAARQQAVETARVMKLSEQLAEANLNLTQQNRFDPLTKLFNRTAWEDAANLEQERDDGRGYSIIMIDIDHFKKLNDSVGHQSGDDCLCHVARAVRESTRGTDIVGRFGGEEFIVFAPGADAAAATALAERIRRAVWSLDIAHPSSPIEPRVTISLGVANAVQTPWPETLALADQALYAAKEAGRNCVRHCDDIESGEVAEGSLV